MGLPSCFMEKKLVEGQKGDDITPFDGEILNKMTFNQGGGNQFLTGFSWIFFMYVLYSTLLHLPPLRFHCVGG
jgi:hypothetical protein